MKILVTGATGLVGRGLVQRLSQRGDHVTALTRREAESVKHLFPLGTDVLVGDPVRPGAWTKALGRFDAVVHLAGESVFDKRWSPEQKDKLRQSRVESTRLLVEAIAKAEKKPQVLVSASAIGYYGARRDDAVGEADRPGVDFLAQLSADWEAAALKAPCRVVTLRIGVVLSPEGGALAKMLPPFKMGLGGPVGDGSQWVSWIHQRDLESLILRVVDDDALVGAINGTAPTPVTNKEFSKTLAKALHRPCLFAVPVPALRLMFGEVADVMAGGQRVEPRRALAAGFRFSHPTLTGALADVLR